LPPEAWTLGKSAPASRRGAHIIDVVAKLEMPAVVQAAPTPPAKPVHIVDVMAKLEAPARMAPAAFTAPSKPAAAPAPKTSDNLQLVRASEPALLTVHDTQGRPGEPLLRIVNSRHINLGYELKNIGPSGIAGIELWATRDGRMWQKYSTSRQTQPLGVVVPDDDLYGFTLIVRDGKGAGRRPPQDGDDPQVWVEVDSTPPDVRLLGVEMGRGGDAHTVTVLWHASDKNLTPRPITLAYAEKPEGPWLTLANQIENTGRYVGPTPADLPAHFFLRIEASDRAGNLALVTTPTAISNELAQPTASIIAVEAEPK
jgi:hypothetical protein